MSLKGVNEVLERREGNRRAVNTDWDVRSSTSQSVFRIAIDNHERESCTGEPPLTPNGRCTPSAAAGAPRLQVGGGVCRHLYWWDLFSLVQSLIDVRENHFWQGTYERRQTYQYQPSHIDTLTENAAKDRTYGHSHFSHYLGFPNTKTSLHSVITSPSATPSSPEGSNPSSQGTRASLSYARSSIFAQRIKKVQLNLEVGNMDVLIERYRKTRMRNLLLFSSPFWSEEHNA